MNFILTETLSPLHQSQLFDLYTQMWWAEDRTTEDLHAILQHSSFIIGIIDTQSDQLVGFARVLTDYTTLAYILDVIVSTSYRGKALGKLLMQSIIHHKKLKKVKKIELACKTEMIPFYEQFGFTEAYTDTLVMRLVS
jgi:predicted GNAT family N-acyltransferase